MKISYADYIKKTDVSVLVAEVIFSELDIKYPIKFISEVADTTSGGTPSRGNVEYYNGDIPWLKSGELNDGIIENAAEYITKKGLASSSAKLHPKNTLLLAMYGATAGRTGIAKMEVSTNQAVCALFPKENVTLEYLFWFLRQYRYKFIEISKGGAQPNISQSVINETKIPVPDLALQKQISDTLTKIEKEGLLDISIIPNAFREKVNRVFASKKNVFEIDIELNNQLSLVKKLRQQLLQDAVQGKLVEQDPNDEPASELLKKIKVEKEQLIKEKKLKLEKELPPVKDGEIPFKIPVSWEWCRLGTLCDNITKGSSPKWQGIQYVDESNGILYITSKNVDSFKINLTKATYVEQKFNEIEPRSILRKGDLLTNIVGASIGRTALFDLDVIANINQAVCILRIEHNNINKDYLLYLMNSNFALKMMSDSQFAPGRANLSMGNIATFPIPIPPLPEQHRIVLKIKQLMQSCDELEESIKQSTSQNEKLLQQVLRKALQH